MDDRVLLDVAGGVATVWLNRADKRNGLDLGMFEALSNAGAQLAERRDVRAVVLAGKGASFCAGLDFASFLSLGEGAKKLLEGREAGIANLAQRAGWVWRELPMPVVAAVQGHAYGGGLQIALGADVRFAHPEAKLCVMEMRYGLIPDMGASKTLLGLVRPDVAAELIYTARVVSGTEAADIGLVTRVADDPHAAAIELARTIADQSPHAVRAAKQLLARAPRLDDAGALKLETELQLGLLGSPNQMEAVQASMTRRPARFSDLE